MIKVMFKKKYFFMKYIIINLSERIFLYLINIICNIIISICILAINIQLVVLIVPIKLLEKIWDICFIDTLLWSLLACCPFGVWTYIGTCTTSCNSCIREEGADILSLLWQLFDIDDICDPPRT